MSHSESKRYEELIIQSLAQIRIDNKSMTTDVCTKNKIMHAGIICWQSIEILLEIKKIANGKIISVYPSLLNANVQVTRSREYKTSKSSDYAAAERRYC